MVIPALAQARSIKPGQALNQVRQQAQEWKQHRAEQPIVRSTRLPTVVSDNKQKLSILTKTPNLDDDSNPQSVELADMQQQNQLLQEQIGSKVQENLELRSRIGDLELMLKKQEAIIEVQNKQLARLQEILERFEDLPPINSQPGPLAGPKSSPQASTAITESELNADLKMIFDEAWLALKAWSQQPSPLTSQKSSPQASAAIAESELNVDLKETLDKAIYASQQVWLELKAWFQQQSVAFLLGISSLFLWLLVMFILLLLRRRKLASEPVSSPEEPHLDPQAIVMMDEKTEEVAVKAVFPTTQEPQIVGLDDQALKDLADDVAELEPDDDYEELLENAATKLDLVAVLLEMGDVDSARESLREVIAEGDAEQVKRAQQILATID